VSFQGKYQIQSALGGGEAPSFRAVQISTGQPVLIHHLAAGKTPPQQPDLAILIFKFLCRASDEQSRKLLDMGEDEGRIYVVTPDVPECQDLRQWLLSVTDAQPAAAEPAKETPGPINLDSTRAFTTEALRQALRDAESAPAPHPPSTAGTSSPESLNSTRAYTTEAMRQALRDAERGPVPIPPLPAATTPAVPPAEKGPGALMPPPEVPEAASEVAVGRVTDFTAFWEKTSAVSFAGQPAASAAPQESPKSPEAPSEVPAVTAEFMSFWSSRAPVSIQDAPTEAMPTLRARAADREPRPAAGGGPADAKGSASPVGDVVLIPPETPPPVTTNEAPVPTPLPPPAPKPADKDPGTMILGGFKDLLGESDKAPPPAGTTPPTPSAEEKPGAEVETGENAPGAQIPSGFEVVFQSNKPRSRSTQVGLPNQSGNMAAPAPIAPQTAPEEPARAPAAKALPPVAPPVASPPTETFGGTLVMGVPNSLEEPRQAAGATNEPAAPPSPPSAPQAPKEPESATRFVSVPPPLPASTLRPTPLKRAQPGEYTRMIQNVKAPPGPLPPAGPRGDASAAYRPAANRAAPAATPQPPPYQEAPAPFPASRYVANDAPLVPARKKRPACAPILILGSLFLMTVALLVFFAFKH
jgi:hypothetical protein